MVFMALLATDLYSPCASDFCTVEQYFWLLSAKDWTSEIKDCKAFDFKIGAFHSWIMSLLCFDITQGSVLADKESDTNVRIITNGRSLIFFLQIKPKSGVVASPNGVKSGAGSSKK
jgi:hypothetical protein